MSGGTSVAQLYNSEQIDLLATHFPRRNEPTVAWGKVCSMFQMTPGLRGFWPMSSVDENGNAFDLSGQGRTLSYNGNPIYAFSGLYPSLQFDGAGDFLSRADEAGLDILGTETPVWSGVRGLTLGGWFYFTSLATGDNQGLIGKYNRNAVNQRSYQLFMSDATNVIDFIVSTDGTATVDVAGSAVAADNWYFCVGRFDPSTELAVFVNGVKTTNAVGVPASLFNSTAQFNIGAHSNGALALFAGIASLCFLSAMALSDTYIQALYHHSRSLFGV